MKWKRTNFSTGTKWEPIAGYSRAVKIGPFIHVSGTTSTDEEGFILHKHDPYLQTIQCLKNIESILKNADVSLKDIIRTRIYVTNINDWEKIAKAHAEYFKVIMPATSMVEVSGLISPDIVVEIEAEAIKGDDND
ncbi:MAG: RidA family protein [Candidatus Marinimicrobia bacterium]|jgi:enamine deaminase RidA (YjgF/YER057c/UK114 family)|nr:RidA family protein [Candidatus Neomarinimicrobiota bacterium]MBT3632904.1 RidA family protein [Candidatus Neomarinimicrobiota bacterium]MBT3682014.1 RidA family protein [Candidatus Neomarinimicrobiota bacterium]MBT3758957.1 RidA family protein [Candidatus Neomarinimicrobiota bacterium]MBT3895144.1 RidA family protein [Candidatus Neomarinimicrobiota bacterium]